MGEEDFSAISSNLEGAAMARKVGRKKNAVLRMLLSDPEADDKNIP